MVVNSVLGLNGVRGGSGGAHGHGNGAAIGLAGTVDGAARAGGVHGQGRIGVGLAGTVTTAGNGLAGSSDHSRPLVRVSVANAGGHKAGSIANVSVLNRKGTSGPSAVNVAALNGSGGSSGRVANVSVLNRKGTTGHSAVNVAALNGSGGSSGRVANVSVLNRKGTSGGSALNITALNRGHGQANGFRIINGVPCLADGTPLTGATAKAVLAAMRSSGQQGSMSGNNYTRDSLAAADAGHQHNQGRRWVAKAAVGKSTGSGANYAPAPVSPTATPKGSGGPSDYDRRRAPNKM